MTQPNRDNLTSGERLDLRREAEARGLQLDWRRDGAIVLASRTSDRRMFADFSPSEKQPI